MIEMTFRPQREALLSGHSNTLDVLVSLSAPPAPEDQASRIPLNLSIVLDRSGSMSGRPLEEAKRCAAMIVDRLAPTDRLSLVVYDNKVDVLLSSAPLMEPRRFHAALRQIESGGNTALHAGWLAGAEQAAHHADTTALSRVLLLSDGCANVGLTDAGAIARHCAELAEAGVSTSTYGLGGNFSEDLMTAMAQAGLGKAYYGQTAEDLMDPFQEEFDLLSALCARRLRLSVKPANGVGVEVLNEYPTDQRGRYVLPDLAFGAEAWAVIRLTIPGESVDQTKTLLVATLAYDDLNGKQRSTSATLRLPSLPAEAYAAIAADELVGSRVAELNAARTLQAARTAARAGDWGCVEHFLSRLRAEAEKSPWLMASIRELEGYARRRQTEHFSKEALFRSHKMRDRLVEPSEGLTEWNREDEARKASFLRRKLEQGRRFDPGADKADDQR